MSDLLLGSIFDVETTMASVSPVDFLICSVFSLVLGLIVGLVSSYKSPASKGFIASMGVLPVIVQTVILLVNGNLGAAVAVFGVFNLVRFRSMPGTAKDIVTVFEAMAIGLACGMGYVGLACLLTVIVSVATIIYASVPEKEKEKTTDSTKPIPMVLRITVPEDSDYDNAFDATLNEHCTSWSLSNVETSNMGSLFQLKYSVSLKDAKASKALVDDLRCLNGNLKVSLNMAPKEKEKTLL